MSVDSIPHLLLVVSGTGITQMFIILRFSVLRAWHADVYLGGLRRLHLVWSARSPAFFYIFADELPIDLQALPFELTMPLYYSTIQNARRYSIGSVVPGKPIFSTILAEEVELGSSTVRACGPSAMGLACAEAAKQCQAGVEFDPLSFML